MPRRSSIAKTRARAAHRARKLVLAEQRQVRRTNRPLLHARYDASATTNHNERWWANSDALSAKSANSPGVRRLLRNRSRYEYDNNSWASGMMQTIANHVISSGPRLQMTHLRGDLANEVEMKFAMWAEEVKWFDLLWTMRLTRVRDGEVFQILHNNPSLESPVKLFPKIYEGEQISTPLQKFVPEKQAIDGIVYDRWGQPRIYHLLDQHPGGFGYFNNFKKSNIPAKFVVHEYRPDRPQQGRGIPEITSALPLFAMLRDFDLATLDSAKAAAYHASVVYSDTSPVSSMPPGDDEDIEALDTIALDRNFATTLPRGWKLGQVKAEHPGPQYDEYTDKILNQIARTLNMPFNVAAGNSADYNYASGRLDHQNYFQMIMIERRRTERVNLNKVFAWWRQMAILTEGYLSQDLRNNATDWRHSWQWDGFGHVDPVKEAKGQQIRLENDTTNVQMECAREGTDWQEVQDGNIRAKIRKIKRVQEIAEDMDLELSDEEIANALA